ncbi:glycosyltransferase [Heyndrickxia sp. MSNUG]|uniref:glycosyltransferase n=1 Tax=Heyndrickxia sp. MSNUG TaxID=3136677 RepID=UPI003C2C6196
MISVITCTMREEFIDNVFKNFLQQNLDHKELIIVLNKDSMNLDKWIEKASYYPNIRVYQLHEQASLGDCLNFGILQSTYDIIAKFDDDDYYGSHYLSNAMIAFENKEVMIAGKSSYYIYFKNKKALFFLPGEVNSVTETVAGATLVFRKEIFKDVRFEKVNRAEDYFFIDQSKKCGYPIYALDSQHFVVIRHSIENHSWKISDDELMSFGHLVTYTENFEKFLENSNFVKKRIKMKRSRMKRSRMKRSRMGTNIHSY